MRATGAGIPTARRLDHVAVTVPDLDEAVRVLVEVLGGDLVYRLPPLAHADDWMTRRLDVHPRAVATIAVVRLGPVTNVELFEYRAPGQVTEPPRPVDVGHQHLGLWVDDVEAAVAHLTGQGFRRVGRSWTVPADEPDAGTTWARVRSSCGMQLELRHTPADLPYTRTGSARRFGPCPRWTTGRVTGNSATPVPGLRGVDHIGHTVADLDRALEFYVGVVGAELLHRTGWRELDGDGSASSLGLPAAGRVDRAALRLGPTDNLELWQFEVADAHTGPPRNSDVGGRHLAIAVDDVDAAVAYLVGAGGCTALGAPETITSGPIAGDRWVYLRTPVGLHVEIVNMPDGALPYERETSARRRAANDVTWFSR
ncbi:VOC family protein [Micromonospora sp. WMMD723]|uniref:VOC family protein n=1 Tax=unclassified Micromonospora TaxID=2617518 RepID=UPI003B9496A9